MQKLQKMNKKNNKLYKSLLLMQKTNSVNLEKKYI